MGEIARHTHLVLRMWDKGERDYEVIADEHFITKSAVIGIIWRWRKGGMLRPHHDKLKRRQAN